MTSPRRPRLRFAILLALAAAALPLFWPSGRQAPHYGNLANATLFPREVVVDFKDDADLAQAFGMAQGMGLTPLVETEEPGANPGKIHAFSLPAGRIPSALAALRADPRVEAAEPQIRYEAYWTPNDPRFNEQWNFKRIGVEKAWEVTRGKGITVAVIDTGVAFEKDSKCYLCRDFNQTKFVSPYDFVNKDKHPTDDNGHGTHVAGTIAESTDNGEGVAGIAFEAAIMPIKVLAWNGSGRMSDVAKGIRYAADHGANVINMSLGAPIADKVTHNAVKYARSKGCVIVCAAGNSGGRGVGYPAAYPECIAVSATGPQGDLAPYSSYGPEVAISAPGGDKSKGDEFGVLQNTYLRKSSAEDRFEGPGGAEGVDTAVAAVQEDGYFSFQGTSMASPHVAGVAALIMSAGVKDPDEVRSVLARSARPKEPKEKYGAGELDAAGAVGASSAEAGGYRNKLWLILGIVIWSALTKRRNKDVPGPWQTAVALTVGLILPDLIQAFAGFGSLWNLLGHSVLFPAYLLAYEADSARERRIYGLMAAGLSVHLIWDLAYGSAPFFGFALWAALPWLWLNSGLGVGVFLSSLFRRK